MKKLRIEVSTRGTRVHYRTRQSLGLRQRLNLFGRSYIVKAWGWEGDSFVVHVAG